MDVEVTHRHVHLPIVETDPTETPVPTLGSDDPTGVWIGEA